MNAKLVYPTFSQLNCLDDVVAVLTGETEISNLSASLDQSQSEILSTIPAGWTLHDVPDTDERIVTSPHSDDSINVQKYAKISCDTYRNWRIQIYEGWDNVLHTGTNETPSNSETSYQASLATDAVVYVFASDRFFSVISDRSTQWGISGHNGIPIVAEYAATQDGNITPMYPNFCLIDTYRLIGVRFGVYPVRAKNSTGNDVVGVSGKSYLTAIGIGIPGSTWIGSYFSGGSGSKIVDKNGNFKLPFFELFIQNPAIWSSAPLGNITTNTNIFMAPRNVLTNHENVLKLTETFRAVSCYNNGLTMLFPKG